MKKSLLSSKIFLIPVLLLTFVLVNASIKMHSRSKDVKEYLRATEEEYLSLEKQYQNANNDLEYLKSNTGTEREIRAKFDLAREGEKAVLIIEEESLPIQEPKKKGFFKKIKDWASF